MLGQSSTTPKRFAQHAVAAVQRTFRHRFEQTERRYNRTRWQDFNFQITTGHVIDLLGKVQRVLMENVF
jgi:signal transduction protein with GAF and PtsI domain